MTSMSQEPYFGKCFEEGNVYDNIPRLEALIGSPIGIAVGTENVYVTLYDSQEVVSVSRSSGICQIRVNVRTIPSHLALDSTSNTLYIGLIFGIAVKDLNNDDSSPETVYSGQGSTIGTLGETEFVDVRDILILDPDTVIVCDMSNNRFVDQLSTYTS